MRADPDQGADASGLSTGAARRGGTIQVRLERRERQLEHARQLDAVPRTGQRRLSKPSRGRGEFFTAPYTAQHVVQIPNNVVVTVGVIYFSSTQINIIGAGTGRLRMQHPDFTGAKIARIEPHRRGSTGSTHPIELRSDLTVAVAPAYRADQFHRDDQQQPLRLRRHQAGAGQDGLARGEHVSGTDGRRARPCWFSRHALAQRSRRVAQDRPALATGRPGLSRRCRSTRPIILRTIRQVEVTVGGQALCRRSGGVGATTALTCGRISVQELTKVSSGLAMAEG